MPRFSVSSISSNAFVQAMMGRIAGTGFGRVMRPLMGALGLQDRSNSLILNIGDEGATLVQIRGGQVVDAMFAEAAAEESWDAIREVLQSDPSARIIIVADVLEQMFREDTVPKVGLLDRGKIVKRRLDLTYPNDLLKAALPLPKARGAAQSVLFAALPMSPHLEHWVSFLDQFPNPLSGFYMLPLEAVGVADKLAPSTQGETRRVWRALISQEAASGFRQIFESSGKLVVTRLTQRASLPLTAEAEAMLIERELRSSISYIKRLGFSDADRLDVVVLADPAVCRAVDDRDLPATTVTVYTPYQAGILLDLGEVGREDTPFADVLLGLWVAKKRRPVLFLPTPRIAAERLMASIMRASFIGTAVLTLVAVYYATSLMDDYLAGGHDLASLESEIATANGKVQTELDRVKSYPIPLDELTGIAETEQKLIRDEIDVGDMARKISVILAADGRIISLSYEVPKTTAKAAPRSAQTAKPNDKVESKSVPYEIHLTVKFKASGDSSADTLAATPLAKAILSRLATAFPDCQVKATRMPNDLMINQILEGSALTKVDQARPGAGTGPQAEYSIRRDT